MTKFSLRLVGLILILLPFLDTDNDCRNRLMDRMNGSQIYEVVVTINHLSTKIHG